MNKIQNYMGKRTLLVGDVKSGKTQKTLRLLQTFIRAGYAEDIAVLDLSPDPIEGIGGKLQVPADTPVRYLTASIAAPRMMGRDAAHVRQLAETNARVIEGLLVELCGLKREILFVNDATLYFHAGVLKNFLQAIETASTQIINAYHGDSFADSDLTQRERRLTQDLIETCDAVEYLTRSQQQR